MRSKVNLVDYVRMFLDGVYEGCFRVKFKMNECFEFQSKVKMELLSINKKMIKDKRYFIIYSEFVGEKTIPNEIWGQEFIPSHYDHFITIKDGVDPDLSLL